MHIYQFLAVVGRVGDQLLTSETGETTSHLQGMFFRTARMLEAGMKPVFVFDGKPPQAKFDELQRRGARRGEADVALEKAKEEGNEEDIAKYSKRTTKVTAQHNEECKELLRLMGVPVVTAPSEAEAQCAAMCKDNLVWAISTEDMDALTFATPRLIRNLMAAVSAKLPINLYEHEKVLEGLNLTQEQFIDMCILCGCDYCGTIKGIGALTALKQIQKNGSLEAVLESLDTTKYPIPEPFPYEEAKRLFKEPTVLSKEEMPALKWMPADEDGIIKFLVQDRSFNEERIRNAVKKINSNRGSSNQGRLESFFGPSTTKHSTKRKEPEAKGKAAKKAKKAPAKK